ncbi:MAG TPA: DUF4167 domain-containing protein [Caulobacteraceae bacterium]|nr:DUF4167 domain-containing protein [Caulobacteraceae bacterium]
MKRQRGRNRNGGGKPQHNANRAFESNGPDGIKVRGAAQHVYEKYQQLARDAATAGDRVTAENCLQHAEHYFRVMRAVQPQRPVADIIGRDQMASGYDIDFESEPPAAGAEDEAGEADRGPGDRQERFGADRGGQERFGGDRPRDERPRDDRFWQERRDRGERFDRPERFDRQADRGYGDRGYGERDRFSDRGERFDRGERRDRGYQDRPPRPYRDDRPRFQRDDRDERSRRSDYSPGGSQESFEREEAPPAEARTDSAPEGRVLRADDGGLDQAPAFLRAGSAEPRPDGGEGRRGRRRRAPRNLEAAADAAGPPAEGEQE